MSAEKSSTGKAAPALSVRRLLLIGSGAVTVMHLPFWINWLYANYPELELRVVLTRSAQRFVSAHALTPLIQNVVISDEWSAEPEVGAPHVRLTEWAEAVAVFPATLNYLSRLAAGAADTPSLLALQCCSAPIVLAPALPPGAQSNPIVQDNLNRLALRPNVVVAPTQPVRSLTTRQLDASGTVPFWTIVRLIEECYQALLDKPTQSISEDGRREPAVMG